MSCASWVRIPLIVIQACLRSFAVVGDLTQLAVDIIELGAGAIQCIGTGRLVHCCPTARALTRTPSRQNDERDAAHQDR